jgi:hypothetical protein
MNLTLDQVVSLQETRLLLSNAFVERHSLLAPESEYVFLAVACN